MSSDKTLLVSAATALPDRPTPMPVPATHVVLATPLTAPFPAGLQQVQLGLGCFWGAERLFWQLPGVYTTAVGYAGGHTQNASYRDVCSGNTAHTEVVLVVFDPQQLSFARLLKTFWEAHDPTQGMRQGNDLGTQYRSAIYCDSEEQYQAALQSKFQYEQALVCAGRGVITTEIRKDVPFYYAEDYHQQYLAKHPDGYCGLRGTGVPCAYAN
jgi:peptide-methionine (S)-S-oxide reductase